MVNKYSLNCFDEFTAKFIRTKVRQLLKGPGFTEADRHDLLQDFVVDLLDRRKNFDPELANWEAFVVVVCENFCATILDRRRAGMRTPLREAGSLNRPLPDAEGERTDVGATIPALQQSRRTGQRHRSHEEVWDLTQDIAHLLDQMPPTMRKVCEGIIRSSKAEAVRETGLSQGALYELLGRILTRFEKADLREYLK